MRSDEPETEFDGRDLPADPEPAGESDDPDGTSDAGRLTDGRRRWARRAGRVGLTLLVVAVVLPFVVFAAPQVAGADYSFVVLSGSMEPAISPGDVVVVAGDDPSAVEEGDVITYRRPGEETPTTHRVVGIEGTGDDRRFRTQGDANDDPDGSPVAADQFVGRVTLTIPFIGHVIAFVDTPLGFSLLVVLPIVAFVLSEARALRSRSGAGDAADRGPSEADDRGASGPASRSADATEPPSDPRGRTPREWDGPVGPVVRPAPSADESADGAEGSAGYRITGTDLTATSIVLSVLACYSGWTVYVSFVRTGAPDVVSVVAFTASASTLVLALAVRSSLLGESVDDGPDGASRRRPFRPPATAVRDDPADARRPRSSEFVWYADADETGPGDRRPPGRSDRRSNGAREGSRDAKRGGSR